MEGMAATIRRLHGARPLPPASTKLSALTAFGSNPGALKGWYHVPVSAAAMPLVVVLHGCTQNAAGYDAGAGWSELGRRYGFAVLLPEQQRANNPNGCFNWFIPDDIRRDDGEALSIRQMIGAILARHAIDPARIFVTGLSAGGAMASVMLATYPELFAGGGIIAGLPYGAATSVTQALQRMRGQGLAGEQASADLLRGASSHSGRWPTISVWHGDADTVVDASNADAIIAQWRTLHGVGVSPDRLETVDRHLRRRWLDAAGRVAIEDYRIAGMGHGTPLKTGGENGCGTAGPHMLETGISSTWRLAQSWGLVDGAVRQPTAAAEPAHVAPARPNVPRAAAPSPVQATIERALRSAGLMP